MPEIDSSSTNNRAKGFDSIMIQSAVMYHKYYNYDIMFYWNISFAK